MILVYSREARQTIVSLNPESKKGIKATLESLLSHPYSGKPLQRELEGYWSIPFKRYRILYKIFEQEKKIGIFLVGLRSQIYEDFVRFLSKGESRKGGLL